MRRDGAAEQRVIHQDHPWERARKQAFARWETEVRRVPYGHPLPDLVGFAHRIEPPAHWPDPAETRRLFAFSALPSGPGPTYLATVPARARRPAEGGLLRLTRPVKRTLPSSDPAYGELLIDARNGIASASWEEVLEGVSPRAAANLVPELSALWKLPSFATEALLLPLVGSLPWHGRPAGVDLLVEIAGWPLVRYRNFLSDVLHLAPEWVRSRPSQGTSDGRVMELSSGARILRYSRSTGRPFSVQLRSSASGAPPAAQAGTAPRSIITYGNTLATEFEAFLSSGRSALLLSDAEARNVPRTTVEVPDALRAAVWGLHWWMPEPPDAPDWQTWIRREEPRLVRALQTMLLPRPSGSTDSWNEVVQRREFRDRLAQSTIARARLRGASDVGESDLSAIVDSFVRSAERATAWSLERRGPLSRPLDRTETGRTTRLRRTLEEMIRERSEGLSLSEALTALRSAGSVATEWDVENLLERLRLRGLLYQDRTGRYRLA
jgi:hypothetical protein